MRIRILLFALLLVAAIFGLTLQPRSCFADTCPACGGSGYIACPACGGSGISGYTDVHGEVGAYGCERCGGVRGDPVYGTGRQGSGRIPCPTCGGSGQVQGQQSGQSSSSISSPARKPLVDKWKIFNEQKKKNEEQAKLKSEEFKKNNQEILNRMKGITENELGLKGADIAGEAGAGGLQVKTLFDKGSPGSAPVDTRVKGPSTLDVGKNVNFDAIKVQDGVPDPAQLKEDLLEDFPRALLERTAQPNKEAQEILGSFKTGEPQNPVKNIDNLAPGDVILVAPAPKKPFFGNIKYKFKEELLSKGINWLDRWGSNNWSSPASHAAVFLGERNGKRWYLDNTGAGSLIKEESEFLNEYGARNMDVATLVGQPLSQHEGEELWKGAHELRNTTTYWPSKLFNWSGDAGMVCSESSRWLLMRAGRRVPETQSENRKILGIDIGLNKKQFVTFSPSDFYENQQYFVVHQLGIQGKK